MSHIDMLHDAITIVKGSEFANETVPRKDSRAPQGALQIPPAGRDDKGRGVTQVEVVTGWAETQAPPLRPPDFLSSVVALMDSMRLSLRRAAYVAVAGIAK